MANPNLHKVFIVGAEHADGVQHRVNMHYAIVPPLETTQQLEDVREALKGLAARQHQGGRPGPGRLYQDVGKLHWAEQGERMVQIPGTDEGQDPESRRATVVSLEHNMKGCETDIDTVPKEAFADTIDAIQDASNRFMDSDAARSFCSLVGRASVRIV